jgi:methyl acetate hydrolase
MRRTVLLIFLSVSMSLGCSQTDDPSQIELILNTSVEKGQVPGVIAIAASSDRVLYQGSVGVRDTSASEPMSADTIVRIASMTKAITSVATMQLVEQRKIGLDDPVSQYIPGMANVEVLEGFDGDGQPILRQPKSPVTVRHLLTHTSGYVYEIWNANAARNVAQGGVPSISAGGAGFTDAPLAFDPGTQWEYGVGSDVLGLLIESVSDQTLGQYFEQHIFEPLKMIDTYFEVPEEKLNRLAAVHGKSKSGELTPIPLSLREAGFQSGGGGLFSTAGDYTRFLQSILGGGELLGRRILSAESVELMAQNHIGDLNVSKIIESSAPILSNDIEFMPGIEKKFGLGFLINVDAIPNGRSAGSLSWAGMYNSYYWIDREKNICAVLITQILPFYDADVVALVGEFETAVYTEFYAD